MTLRPYQHRIVDSSIETLGEVPRALVVAPCGAGKTICFAHLADRVSHRMGPFEGTSGKTLVLVNRETLLQQAADKIRRAVGIKVSIERAEERGDIHATVVVATVQSMVRRLEKYDRKHFGLVVVDEAHLFTGDQATKAMDYFECKRVGVTATPQTKGKKALINFYDKIACEISLLELIESGFLVPMKLAMMPLSIDLSGVRTSHGDFVEEDLDKAVIPHFSAVITEMQKYERKWIVFLPLIKSSQLFTSMLNAVGIKAIHVDGAMSDSQEKIHEFATQDYKAICCSSLLSYGYDEPSINGIVNLRATRSEIFYIQAIGRTLRLSPETGKTDSLILDPMYHGYNHRIIRPSFLLAKSEEEAEMMEREMKRGGVSDLMDMHSAMKRQLEENMRKKARKLDIFMMSLLGEHPIEKEVLEYEPVFPWESQPPTIPQIMSLEGAGITRSMIRNKGHASKLFDLLKSRRERNLASIKQCKLLAKLYVPHNPTALLFDDARKLIDETLYAKRGSNSAAGRGQFSRPKFQPSFRMARRGDQPFLPL